MTGRPRGLFVRMDDGLYDAVGVAATAEGLTLAAYVRRAVTRSLHPSNTPKEN